MKKQKLRGIILLTAITVLFAIIVAAKLYNPLTYILLLVLMGISTLRMNDKSLVSANSLFLVFFAYAVGFGPFILLIRGINYNFDYYAIVLGGLLSFCWGNAVAKPKKRVKHKEDKGLFRINISRLNMLRIVMVVSLFTSLYYLISNRQFLLGGNVSSSRIDALSGNGMVLYISQLSIVAVPMLYDLYKKTKNDGRAVISKFELGAYLILSTFSLLVSGFRAPVITLYICLTVLFIRKNNIKNRKVMIFGFVAVLVVEAMGMTRSIISGETLLSKNVFTSLGTSLIVGCINLQYVFNAFPSKIPFQLGYTYFINLKMLLPGPDPDFTLWLKEALNINFSGGGVTPTILGELYMNFNVVGIYIGMFLYGILGVYVWQYFKKHSETFLGVFYVWQFAHAASGGIANVIITVLLYTIVYWCIITCPIYLKGSKYARQQRIR